MREIRRHFRKTNHDSPDPKCSETHLHRWVEELLDDAPHRLEDPWRVDDERSVQRLRVVALVAVRQRLEERQEAAVAPAQAGEVEPLRRANSMRMNDVR